MLIIIKLPLYLFSQATVTVVVTKLRNLVTLISYAPINIFPQRGRGGGGDTLGIRQQNNPSPRGLDRTPKDMGWEIRYFSRSSKKLFII